MSQLNQAIERFSREGFSLTEFVDAARQDGSLVEKCPDCGSALTGSNGLHFPCDQPIFCSCGWCLACNGQIDERAAIEEAEAKRRQRRFTRRRA
jgi:hypothetical protein